MITRRLYLKLAAAAGVTGVGSTISLQSLASETITTRAIPGTTERLPIVGLGTSATFRRLADTDNSEPLSAVISTLLEQGGTVFDTAPSYGGAEQVAGQIVQTLDAEEKVFWATKLNVVPRGSKARASISDAWAQLERSFDAIGKDPIDLIQVHNIADVQTQLGVLKELKEEGRVRHIGVTYTGNARYPELAEVMRRQSIDFIGIDYAVDNRNAADELFPIALDRGIGVLVYLPFGRSRLWKRVGDRALPDWSADIGVTSWAQFFIKFAASHPAVTSVTPATSKAKHMLDNMGAGFGPLPDAKLQARMAAFIDALPAA